MMLTKKPEKRVFFVMTIIRNFREWRDNDTMQILVLFSLHADAILCTTVFCTLDIKQYNSISSYDEV